MSKSKKETKEIKDAEVIVDVVENEETVNNVEATPEETTKNTETVVESVPKRRRFKTPKEFWNDYKTTIVTVIVSVGAGIAGTLLVENVFSNEDNDQDVIDGDFVETDEDTSNNVETQEEI